MTWHEGLPSCTVHDLMSDPSPDHIHTWHWTPLMDGTGHNSWMALDTTHGWHWTRLMDGTGHHSNIYLTLALKLIMASVPTLTLMMTLTLPWFYLGAAALCRERAFQTAARQKRFPVPGCVRHRNLRRNIPYSPVQCPMQSCPVPGHVHHEQHRL